MDMDDLWIVINPQTGMITTGEMATVPAWKSGDTYANGNAVYVKGTSALSCYRCKAATTTADPTGTTTDWELVGESYGGRTLAQDQQGMGGR
jgi:hypothetical protein